MYPFCELFIPSKRNIQSVTDLFENKYIQLSFPDLHKEYYKVDEKLSDDEIEVYLRETISYFDKELVV